MKRKPKSASPKPTKQQPGTKTDVLVSVADDHIGKIHEVEHHLKAAGLEVAQVMPASGVITGSVTDAGFEALSKVPGVSAIEKSQSYQLPPPDSDIQ